MKLEDVQRSSVNHSFLQVCVGGTASQARASMLANETLLHPEAELG